MEEAAEKQAAPKEKMDFAELADIKVNVIEKPKEAASKEMSHESK